jgi:serine phosphatase RsbU (regulator of sigma subunit)
MDESVKGRLVFTSGGRVQSRGTRGAQALVHLPTWSRLNVAARQWAPAGNGGDFFEIIQQRDGRVSAIMADVSGNGPSAAGPVASLRWVMRQAIARGQSPGAVLEMLNDWLVRQQVDDRFVTAVCVRVNPITGDTEIASAGHLGPFVKRARGGAEDLPPAVGLALGILPGQTYREMTLELRPEDALVLVTDGITDRLGTASDPLGQRALLDRLQRAQLSPESICGALLGPSARFAEDATVVVMQMPRRHRRATPIARAG